MISTDDLEEVFRECNDWLRRSSLSQNNSIKLGYIHTFLTIDWHFDQTLVHIKHNFEANR